MGKRMTKVCLLLLCIGLESSLGASITIAWDANKENDLLGYRIHWGTVSKRYQNTEHVGVKTTFRLDNLQDGIPYYVAVSAIDYWGNESDFSRELRIVPGEPLPTPTELELSENYPNPFNPETFFNFSVPQMARLTLTVYNSLGQAVRVLESGTFEPGAYQTFWDGLDEYGNRAPSGIYVCRLDCSLGVLTRRITFLH